jgi:hypothetical protein
MTRAKWEVIGLISVDAGCITIGDPCYGEAQDWSNYMDEEIPHDSDLEVPKELRRFGKAVIMQSGLGDGVYAVEVKRDPNAHGMIKEMRIKFF